MVGNLIAVKEKLVSGPTILKISITVHVMEKIRSYWAGTLPFEMKKFRKMTAIRRTLWKPTG